MLRKMKLYNPFSMTQTLKDKGLNVNTIVGLMSLLGGLVTVIFYVAPLKNLPEDQRLLRRDFEEVKKNVNDMSTAIAVQTESVKQVTDISKDTRELRRDLDKSVIESAASQERQDMKIEQLKEKINKIEK